MPKVTLIADIDCSISEYGRELVFLKAGEAQRITLERGFHQLNACGFYYGEEYTDTVYEGIHIRRKNTEIETQLLFKQVILYVEESRKRRISIESKTMSLSGLTAYLSQIDSGVKMILTGDGESASFREIVVPSKCTFNQRLQDIVYAWIGGVVGSVYLPDNLSSFSFEDAKGVKYVYLPDTIKRIPKQAFAKSGIESLLLPYGIEEIDKSAFADCCSLKQIVFPPHLKKIGESAFAGCKSLNEVVFYSSKVSVDRNAFEYCTNIKNVIADSLESWCSYDFKNSSSNPVCYSSKLSIKGVEISGELKIPKTITRIKKYAFCELESIKSVVISGSVQCIDEDAFYRCININTIRIEEGTSVVGKRAFAYLSNLRRIDLPRSIKTIWISAFQGCEKLKHINYSGDIKSWCEIEFDDYDYKSNYSHPELRSHGIKISSKEIKGELKLPDTVLTVSPYAFAGCDGITSIVVSNKVTIIGKSAFENCSSVTKVELKKGCETIGERAFANLSNLSIVTLPESLSRIEDSAFMNCVSLEQLHIPDNVSIIGDRAFCNCSMLSSMIIPDKVENLGYFVFDGCAKLESIQLPSQLKKIGPFAFSGCINLKKIELPMEIEQLGDGAFSHCESIKSMVIPDHITAVPTHCFGGCNNLKCVILGSGIERIGAVAFNDIISEIVIKGLKWPELETYGFGRGDNYRETNSFGYTTYERQYSFAQEQDVVKFDIYCDEKMIATMPGEWERHCKKVFPLSKYPIEQKIKA